jgi:hypothetical protein
MANWREKTGAPQASGQKAEADGAGAELEYLYRDDLAYGQLAIEITDGELEANEDADPPPLDGWLSDM